MKRSKITLVVYSDPGHAWVKVPKSLLVELGIEDKITRYSYKRKDSVFLECDCDMTTLVQTLESTYPNIKIKYNEKCSNKSSKIRSYIPYTQLDIFKNYSSYSGL